MLRVSGPGLTITRRNAISGVFSCASLLGITALWAKPAPAAALFIYDGRFRESAEDAQDHERLGVPIIDCSQNRAGEPWHRPVSDTLAQGGCVKGTTLWIDSHAAEAFARDCARDFYGRSRSGCGHLRTWTVTA